jgi:hypothetical protein
MFEMLVIALGLAAILFLVYLAMKAYFPKYMRQRKRGATIEDMEAKEEEGFQASAPKKPTKVNTPSPPVPAPAPPQYQDPPMEEREIAPGGPSTPSARAPVETVQSISPDAKPLDPYDDQNMEAPIHDSLRYPELSFGPGVENSGMNQLATSGVGSAKVMAGSSPFSPDFAQNGATFMGDVTANDLSHDDFYGSA